MLNLAKVDPAWADEFYGPDGRKLTYDERAAVRRRKDAERSAQTVVPQIERPPVTRAQFERLQRAEREGKALAAEKLAAVDTDPNPWRREIEAIQGRPDRAHRLAKYQQWAREWDEKHAAELAEAERRERIENDPSVATARAIIESQMRSASDDERAELTTALAYLNESGDTAGTYQMTEPVEVRRAARWTRELEEKSLRTAKEFEERAALEVQLRESQETLAAIQKAAE